MSEIGPADTKPILQTLLDLGLGCDVYSTRLHHSGHSPPAMLHYGVGRYRANGKNVLLHRKLEWILRTYENEWKLEPGRADVFEALISAANLGIR